MKSAVDKLNSISSSLKSVGSSHRRTKWLSDRGYLIMPEELELGCREEQRYVLNKQSLVSISVSDIFQYVSLKKLLPKVLENT